MKLNSQTNKWAVQVSTGNVSEAIQRIAFTFGYGWPVNPKQQPGHLNAKFLIFDPETKTITWCNYLSDVEPLVNQLVQTFDQVVNLFTNPPKKAHKVGNIEIFPDGTVKVANIVTLGKELFEKVVTERDIFLGRNKPAEKVFPSVTFSYTSKSSGKKVRRIAVVEVVKDSYIAGLDLDDENRFKKFLFANMNTQPVFVGFVS